MTSKSLRTPYRSSQLAIDERRAADAGIGGSMERYEAQREANRVQALREERAFWQVTNLMRERKPVPDDVLDLAVLYVARHGDSVPPTMRYDQVPAYRVACSRINTAARNRRRSEG